MPFPPPLLTVIYDDLAMRPPLFALCAGYERGSWRAEQLSEYLMRWLLDFALADPELADLDAFSARDALKKAALEVYQSSKYKSRGEFGELLLHAALRQYFHTLPAIRKLYFKDSPNDTVKGFDAVHVAATGDDLELWLGEVKFYTDLSAAIRDVAKELHAHAETDFLRSEFLLIMNKLDRAFPHFERLRLLLDPATSLDTVFARVRVPVLLTYDSEITERHTAHSEEYLEQIRAELRDAHAKLVDRKLPVDLQVHLMLIPLATKAALASAFHNKLVGLQQ